MWGVGEGELLLVALKSMYNHIDQDHLNLISQIYDLPLRPDNWPEVLEAFAPMSNASLAGIAIYDPQYPSHQLNTVNSSCDILQSEEYRNMVSANSGYQSPFANLTVNPKRAFVRDMDMLELDSVEKYAQRPMIQWLDRNYGVFHGAASCLNLERAWTDILFLMFPNDRGPITPAELNTCNFFLDHFAKCTELGRAFNVLKGRFNGALAALDRYHIGIFVLSANGSVVLKNVEANRLVDAGDGLTLTRTGKLHPMDDGHSAALNDAIAKAIHTAHAEHSCAETVLPLSRRSGDDPYLVEVSPICDNDELESQFKGCLVFVIDPTKTDVVSTEGMQVLFSLTKSESEVCRLVALGLETDDIADARNLTRETVRNYIKQVLHKTGTKNRSQLVRLALNVNLPIDPASIVEE